MAGAGAGGELWLTILAAVLELPPQRVAARV